MISTLSNLADRNFVLGFLLPVIIASLLACAVFADVPEVEAIWMQITNADSLEKLVVVVIGLWTAAVLLFVLNRFIQRLMQGYWGPFKWIGLFLRRQQEAYDKAACHRDNLERKFRAGDRAAFGAYQSAKMDFCSRFPAKRSRVQPTKFGNVMRAAESYSREVYGVDAIGGWPRLAGVIPEAFQTKIDNAHAEIDFFLNNCVLFFLLGIACLCAIAWNAAPSSLNLDPIDTPTWFFLGVGLAAPVVAFWCYRLALLLAPNWGDLLRSASDLYLPDLVKQMGYELPATKEERAAFFEALNKTFYTNEPIDPRFWASKAAPPEPPGKDASQILLMGIDLSEE